MDRGRPGRIVVREGWSQGSRWGRGGGDALRSRSPGCCRQTAVSTGTSREGRPPDGLKAVPGPDHGTASRLTPERDIQERGIAMETEKPSGGKVTDSILNMRDLG